eukprot:scaffold1.g5821.t1
MEEHRGTADKLWRRLETRNAVLAADAQLLRLRLAEAERRCDHEVRVVTAKLWREVDEKEWAFQQYWRAREQLVLAKAQAAGGA